MLDKILKFLANIKTFKQLSLIFIGGVLAMSMYVFWENKDKIIDRFSAKEVITSEMAKDELNKLFNFSLQTPEVNTVLLYSVNLATNQKMIVSWKSKEAIISAEIDKLKQQRPIAPLFSESNPQDNIVMAQIINNKIVCIPYEKYSNPYSEAVDAQIKAVCMISVPPIFGKTSGILKTYLYKEPSTDEAQQLALTMNEVSSSIIRKDLLEKIK